MLRHTGVTALKRMHAKLTIEALELRNWIFTHLKLCLADAIHSFKWVKKYILKADNFYTHPKLNTRFTYFN